MPVVSLKSGKARRLLSRSTETLEISQNALKPRQIGILGHKPFAKRPLSVSLCLPPNRNVGTANGVESWQRLPKDAVAERLAERIAKALS